jgi:outer membrane protein assembly factor BamB
MNSDGLIVNSTPSLVEGVDRFTCIIPIEAGSYVVGGAIGNAAQVTRFNEDGSAAWTLTNSNGTNSMVERLCQKPDGMIVAFCTNGPTGWVVMIDPLTGAEQWSTVVGADLFSYTLEGGSVLADGSLISFGNQGSGDDRRAVVERHTHMGVTVWRQYYSYALDDGSQGPVSISDLVVTPTQDLLMVGTAHAIGQGWAQLFDQDAWLMKVDQDGCLVPSCSGVWVTELASKQRIIRLVS